MDGWTYHVHRCELLIMERATLLKFIKESRELAKDASIEKKIKLLKLIKEATIRLNAANEPQTTVTSAPEFQADSSKNTDYLDEV